MNSTDTAFSRAPFPGIRCFLLLGVSLFPAVSAAAGAVPGWPEGVREISYRSPADGTRQPALFYAPQASGPRPLLVGLHTWSGDYRQAGGETAYARWCIEKGWLFIHPHFRGPNRTPAALGSERAVGDIVGAVDFVKRNHAVDADRVYLVGVSGGGHAALLMAGRAPKIWAGVSAWCGIADIRRWWEQKTAGGRYARQIEKACGGRPDRDPAAAAACRTRSPLTWLPDATAVNLDINAGIRDGRKGSVPFTHSLRAFNAVAREADRIPDDDIALFYRTMKPPGGSAAIDDPRYGKKRPLFRKTSRNARVTIFDGGHEIVHAAALAWLEKQRRGIGNIDALLEPIRRKHGLPALAAAAVAGGRIVTAGAVGTRKAGATPAVSLDDRFHVGSCTKSMTATLAAILVKRKILSWDTTLAAAFPDLRDSMHEGFRTVTLRQLLRHRGRMPGDLGRDGLWKRVWAQSTTLDPPRQRRFLLREILKREPGPAGTFVYANAGYAAAGAMIETIAGEPWETLMRRFLFKPLGMKTAGFGPPASPDTIDQPWGHVIADGEPKPVPPGPRADNPPAIGPAGTVHCSILDFARYAACHLRGRRNDTGILPRSSFRELHTPAPGHGYALGWRVVRRDWGGTVLTHAGSNTMFFAVAWLAPEKNFAAVVACNLGGTRAETGCDRAAGTLVEQYCRPADTADR